MTPVVRAGLVYAGLRLTLFVGALGLGVLVGLRGVLLVAVAFGASALAGYPLARRQREALARAVQDRR